MNRKFIIGDIHGCLNTFNALLDQFKLEKTDFLYLLGDYIDRGPDSKGVIDRILKLKEDGYQVIALRGNHEQMFIDSYRAEVDNNWFSITDKELLNSFNVLKISEIPADYIEFCNELPYFHEDDDFILVHAGMNFESENPLADKKALLWARNWYEEINYDWLGSKKIIHGHTMQSVADTKSQFKELNNTQIIDIDCGACVSKYKAEGLGQLCGLDYTNKKLYFQENIEVSNNF